MPAWVNWFGPWLHVILIWLLQVSSSLNQIRVRIRCIIMVSSRLWNIFSLVKRMAYTSGGPLHVWTFQKDCFLLFTVTSRICLWTIARNMTPRFSSLMLIRLGYMCQNSPFFWWLVSLDRRWDCRIQNTISTYDCRILYRGGIHICLLYW